MFFVKVKLIFLNIFVFWSHRDVYFVRDRSLIRSEKRREKRHKFTAKCNSFGAEIDVKYFKCLNGNVGEEVIFWRQESGQLRNNRLSGLSDKQNEERAGCIWFYGTVVNGIKIPN